MLGSGVLGRYLLGGQLPGVASAGITISAPAATSTIANEVAVIGTTSTGGDVEYQIDGGSWSTLATPSAGGYSGVITGLVAGARTIGVRQSDNAANTASVSVTVVNDAITISSPVDYGFKRRGASATANVAITFSWTGIHATGFEARFNRTGAEPWTTFTPGSGPATITLTGEARGSGSLQVRSKSNAFATASVAHFSVGRSVGVIGDSNASGRGATQSDPSNGAGGQIPHMYDNAGGFHPVKYPIDALPYGGSETYSVLADASAVGSWALALASDFVNDGEPVLIVVAAKGGSGIGDYARSVSTATMYGAMKARFDAAGGVDVVVVHTGNNDVTGGMSQATHQAALLQLVSDLRSDWAGARVVINKMNYDAGTPSVLVGIRAAQQYVIDNATGAYAGGDVSPITALHFGTTGEMSGFSAEVYVGIKASFPATAVTLTLTTDGTTPAAALTGLKWAFFDQVTPDLFAAPVAQGAVESTDASGVLVLDITGSALAPGAVGWLIVTNSDGTTTQSPAHKLFAGPVTVS